MVTSIGDDPLRMTDRRDLLTRTLRVIACSPFDGLLATSDLIDELFILQQLSKRKNFLARKLLIGSTNRGGLSGSAFELDDRLTGYDPKGIEKMRLDGAKFLLRMDAKDKESLQTFQLCADLVRECSEIGIPFFLELLPVSKNEERVTVEHDVVKLAKLVGVATALGNSSSRLWLKLPYVDGFEAVARATTCPILLLGGEVKGGVDELFEHIETGMKAGPNVRGVLMGRNVLYPPGLDPAGIAAAIDAMVHHGADARRAKEILEKESWRKYDLFDE
jgi:tagatose-1,6-bisphosphate aldolase